MPCLCIFMRECVCGAGAHLFGTSCGRYESRGTAGAAEEYLQHTNLRGSHTISLSECSYVGMWSHTNLLLRVIQYFFPISDNMSSMGDDLALRAREGERSVLAYAAAEGEGKTEESEVDLCINCGQEDLTEAKVAEHYDSCLSRAGAKIIAKNKAPKNARFHCEASYCCYSTTSLPLISLHNLNNPAHNRLDEDRVLTSICGFDTEGGKMNFSKFVCHNCRRTFKNTDALNTHRCNVQPEFDCPACVEYGYSATFFSIEELHLHLEQTHQSKELQHWIKTACFSGAPSSGVGGGGGGGGAAGAQEILPNLETFVHVPRQALSVTPMDIIKGEVLKELLHVLEQYSHFYTRPFKVITTVRTIVAKAAMQGDYTEYQKTYYRTQPLVIISEEDAEKRLLESVNQLQGHTLDMYELVGSGLTFISTCAIYIELSPLLSLRGNGSSKKQEARGEKSKKDSAEETLLQLRGGAATQSEEQQQFPRQQQHQPQMRPGFLDEVEERHREIDKMRQISLTSDFKANGVINTITSPGDRHCLKRAINCALFSKQVFKEICQYRNCGDHSFSKYCNKCCKEAEEEYFRKSQDVTTWDRFDQNDIWLKKGEDVYDVDNSQKTISSFEKLNPGKRISIYEMSNGKPYRTYKTRKKHMTEKEMAEKMGRQIEGEEEEEEAEVFIHLLLSQEKGEGHYRTIFNISLFKRGKRPNQPGYNCNMSCISCERKFSLKTRGQTANSQTVLFPQSICCSGGCLEKYPDAPKSYNEHVDSCEGDLNITIRHPYHKHARVKNKYGSMDSILLIAADFETRKINISPLCLFCRRLEKEMTTMESKQKIAIGCREKEHLLAPAQLCEGCLFNLETSIPHRKCKVHDRLIQDCAECWRTEIVQLSCTHSKTEDSSLLIPCAYSLAVALMRTPGQPEAPVKLHKEIYKVRDILFSFFAC